MMGESQKLRSAGELALAFRKSPETIRHALAHIEPAGTIERFGNKCSGWYFTALPQSWREDLARTALKRRMTIEELIDFASKPWKPAVPLAGCLPADIEKAKRLRSAWTGTIDRMRSPALLPGELVRLGVRDYEKEFGFKITDKYWNFLHDRLLSRDGGAENFGRLELYLDDNARRAKSNQLNAPSVNCPPWLVNVDSLISGFANPLQITRDQETCLWARIMEAMREREKDGMKVPVAKRAIVSYLLAKLPAIAATASGLRKKVDRQWGVYVSSDGDALALADKRTLKSGNFRAPDLSQDESDHLIDHARHNCGGRISQAWRELLREKKFSPEILNHYQVSRRSKSWVPKRIRDLIRHEVSQGLIYEHGPKQAKLSAVSIPGDWENCDFTANDWYQGDDVTINHVAWFKDPRTGEIVVTRGQLLLMIDVRSKKILNFVYLDSKSYDSFAITALMKQTRLKWGDPFEGWAFERGLWKDSKLVKANQNVQTMSYERADIYARKCGLKFRHSLLPRGKIIELVNGIIQNGMQGLPGYVGRNEVSDRYEETQELIAAARAGRVDPSKYFLHVDDMPDHLVRCFEAYNDDPQFGPSLKGLSPNEAYRAFANPKPMRQYLPEMACLLNPYLPVTISRNRAITFKIGKRSFTYANEELGKLIGHDRLASFDLEDMDRIAVTDLNFENMIIVPRLKEVPKTTATKEQLREANQQVESFTAYFKARHRTLREKRENKWIDPQVRADLKKHAGEFNQKMSDAREITTDTRRRAAALERNAEAAGVMLTPAVKERNGAADAMARVAQKRQAWLESKQDK